MRLHASRPVSAVSLMCVFSSIFADAGNTKGTAESAVDKFQAPLAYRHVREGRRQVDEILRSQAGDHLWKCKCGAVENITKFCHSCTAPQPSSFKLTS